MGNIENRSFIPHFSRARLVAHFSSLLYITILRLAAWAILNVPDERCGCYVLSLEAQIKKKSKDNYTKQ